MKKAVLIINPSSGDEKALEYKDKLFKKASEYFDEVKVRMTEKEDDATKFAKEAAEDRCDAIFAFGGALRFSVAGLELAENRWIDRPAGVEKNRSGNAGADPFRTQRDLGQGRGAGRGCQ